MGHVGAPQGHITLWSKFSGNWELQQVFCVFTAIYKYCQDNIYFDKKKQGFVKGEELSSYCDLISSLSFIYRLTNKLTPNWQNVSRQAVRLYLLSYTQRTN